MSTLREIRDLLREIRDLLARAERHAKRELVVNIDGHRTVEKSLADHRRKKGLGLS
jgi:hypothetical protein